MKDEDKTKEQLIKEIKQLRQRNTELKESETEGKRTEKALRENACQEDYLEGANRYEGNY